MRTQQNPPEHSITPNLSLQILFTQILKQFWRCQDKFCAVHILNCVKLTQASITVCVPIWLFDALLCFCWLSFLCFLFMFLVRRETPVWMIIKNAEKQRKKEQGGREGRWKDTMQGWVSPCPWASWGLVCLAYWFCFNRGLTGVLEFDGQIICAISWFCPQAKLFGLGGPYLNNWEIDCSRYALQE